jgi:hypothetical protein
MALLTRNGSARALPRKDSAETSFPVAVLVFLYESKGLSYPLEAFFIGK